MGKDEDFSDNVKDWNAANPKKAAWIKAHPKVAKAKVAAWAKANPEKAAWLKEQWKKEYPNGDGNWNWDDEEDVTPKEKLEAAWKKWAAANPDKAAWAKAHPKQAAWLEKEWKAHHAAKSDDEDEEEAWAWNKDEDFSDNVKDWNAANPKKAAWIKAHPKVAKAKVAAWAKANPEKAAWLKEQWKKEYPNGDGNWNWDDEED